MGPKAPPPPPPQSFKDVGLSVFSVEWAHECNRVKLVNMNGSLCFVGGCSKVCGLLWPGVWVQGLGKGP